MQHCKDHTGFLEKITEATIRIENMQKHIIDMHTDIKATRKEVSEAVSKAEAQLITNTQDIAVFQERWKNAKWVAGSVIAVEIGIVIKIISEFITR